MRKSRNHSQRPSSGARLFTGDGGGRPSAFVPCPLVATAHTTTQYTVVSYRLFIHARHRVTLLPARQVVGGGDSGAFDPRTPAPVSYYYNLRRTLSTCRRRDRRWCCVASRASSSCRPSAAARRVCFVPRKYRERLGRKKNKEKRTCGELQRRNNIIILIPLCIYMYIYITSIYIYCGVGVRFLRSLP